MKKTMKFLNGTQSGRLLKRYKRFLADIELHSGEIITAHCPNPGAMLDIKDPGLPVWVSQVPDHIERKLRYTWEIVKAQGTLVGINTMHPNRLIEEALKEKKIELLKDYTSFKKEVKYGKNSRIDFLLEREGAPSCYVEIKNVHLKRGEQAAFPDSVTARGAKHLQELSEVVAGGGRAVMLYCIQRSDCAEFTLAADIDPHYAALAREAVKKGVEMIAYTCTVTPEEIKIAQQIPVCF